MKFACLLMLFAAVFSTTSCSRSIFPGVHRVTVSQGHVIDTEELKQLEKGMTKRQVQYLLGTPLGLDAFDPDRWEYFYSLRNKKGKLTKFQLSVLFENNEVISFDGNYLDILKDNQESASDLQEKSAD